MTLQTKHATALLQAIDDSGSFDLILSTGDLDRDGEVVAPGSWALPLPDTIPLNVNHSRSVEDIIGSGEPWIDANGNLRVKGTFASTPQAQHVRSLVAEGHLRSVSVEFLRRKGASGQPVNELVGGAFVLVPSNTGAIVLSAKAFSDHLARVIKSATEGGADTADAMIQAIHDAAGHLGAQCVVAEVQDVDPTGVDDGANKAAALRLRLKALRR